MTIVNFLLCLGISVYMARVLWPGVMTGVGPHGDEHVLALGDLPLPCPISLRAFSVALLMGLGFAWGVNAVHLATRGLHL